MQDYNRVILTGHLTHDPEIRYTPKGKAVCNFNLAVNRTFNDTNNEGEPKKEVVFLDITTWANLAEVCNKYLTKGKRVLVEGRLVADVWEDKVTKQQRTKIKINATEVNFLSLNDKNQTED